MEDYLTFNEIRERKEELKRERAELGNPHSKELKNLEKPLEYILETENKFFDPLHAIELWGETYANDLPLNWDEAKPINEILDGKTASWEEEYKRYEETGDVCQIGSEKLFDKIDRAMVIYQRTSLSEDSVLDEEFSQWYEKLHEKTLMLGQIKGAVSTYAIGSGIQNNAEGIALMAKTNMERMGQIQEHFEVDLPSYKRTEEMLELPVKHHHMANPKTYRGCEVKIPEPSPQLRFTIAERILDKYEEEIRERKENKETQPEKPRKQTIHTKSSRIDWKRFEQEYGEVPEENKQLYEKAAMFQKRNKMNVNKEFLGKIMADLEGMNPEYRQNPKLMEGFGELKKAVDSTEKLDFKLPVMSKELELQRICETVDYTEKFMTEKEYRIERTIT